MLAYMNRGKTTSEKRKSGRKLTLTKKRPSYIEKDSFEKSQDYCSTGGRTAELNTHPEDPVSKKKIPTTTTKITHPWSMLKE
jgi:hypothetical protein